MCPDVAGGEEAVNGLETEGGEDFCGRKLSSLETDGGSWRRRGNGFLTSLSVQMFPRDRGAQNLAFGCLSSGALVMVICSGGGGSDESGEPERAGGRPRLDLLRGRRGARSSEAGLTQERSVVVLSACFSLRGGGFPHQAGPLHL